MRIVHGAMCVWWDSIDKVATLEDGLPCCPNCHGVLFEVASEEEWMEGVNMHDMINPGYRDFILWLRGKCFPTIQDAQRAMLIEKGEI